MLWKGMAFGQQHMETCSSSWEKLHFLLRCSTNVSHLCDHPPLPQLIGQWMGATPHNPTISTLATLHKPIHETPSPQIRNITDKQILMFSKNKLDPKQENQITGKLIESNAEQAPSEDQNKLHRRTSFQSIEQTPEQIQTFPKHQFRLQQQTLEIRHHLQG